MVYIVKTDNRGEMLDDELWNVWQELQLQTFCCSVTELSDKNVITKKKRIPTPKNSTPV